MSTEDTGNSLCRKLKLNVSNAAPNDLRVTHNCGTL